MKTRIYPLDFLRAFLMFLGVFLHGLSFDPHFSFLDDGWCKRLVIFVSESIHTFRMPLFFCLSGYFSSLLLVKLGFRKFLLNRGKRIILPLLFSIVTLGMLTNLAYHALGLVNAGYDSFAALKTAVSLRYFVFGDFKLIHLWFLYYLVAILPAALLAQRLFGKLFFRVSVWVARRKGPRIRNRQTTVLLLAAFPAVFLCLTHNNGNPTPLGFRITWADFLPYFYCFEVGWCMHWLKVNLADFVPGAKRFLAAGFLLTIVWLWAWRALDEEFFFVTTGIYSISLWCYVFGLLGLAQVVVTNGSPLLQYFSDSSYWIYLVHLPVIVFLKVFSPGPVPILSFVLLLGLTLYLCIASYNYLVRPTPIGWLLNGKIRKPLPIHKLSFFQSLLAGKTESLPTEKTRKLIRTKRAPTGA